MTFEYLHNDDALIITDFIHFTYPCVYCVFCLIVLPPGSAGSRVMLQQQNVYIKCVFFIFLGACHAFVGELIVQQSALAGLNPRTLVFMVKQC